MIKEGENLPAILYVDDMTTNLKIFKAILKNEFHVFLAANRSEALEIIKTKPIRLVISDLSMPDISGLDLLEEINTLLPGVYTFLISGINENTEIRTAIEQGKIRGFISKPVDYGNLKQKLQDLLEYKSPFN